MIQESSMQCKLFERCRFKPFLLFSISLVSYPTRTWRPDQNKQNNNRQQTTASATALLALNTGPVIIGNECFCFCFCSCNSVAIICCPVVIGNKLSCSPFCFCFHFRCVNNPTIISNNKFREGERRQ